MTFLHLHELVKENNLFTWVYKALNWIILPWKLCLLQQRNPYIPVEILVWYWFRMQTRILRWTERDVYSPFNKLWIKWLVRHQYHHYNSSLFFISPGCLIQLVTQPRPVLFKAYGARSEITLKGYVPNENIHKKPHDVM